MAELTFFELSDVADLLQLSISTVKNWTIGRPLSIKPSIRASQGKGSRNLYSREDVYVLALAAQLSRDGFAIKTVQEVLRRLKGESNLLGSHYSALVISSFALGPKIKAPKIKGPEIKFLSEGPITIGVHEQLRADVIGRYVLNIAKLVALVETGLRTPVPGTR